jgi:hypothetical protein
MHLNQTGERWLNAALTGIIGDAEIGTDWKSLLVHGVVLFIALAIAHIPASIINLAVPGLTTMAVLFVVNCFVGGFVARTAAGYWEEEYDDDNGEMV